MSTTLGQVLRIKQGSIVPFEAHVYGTDDELLDTTGADGAVLAITEAVGDDPFIEFSLGDNLTIANGVLTCTMTQLEADALPIGEFIADGAVGFSGQWKYFKAFRVVISPAIAEHP